MRCRQEEDYPDSSVWLRLMYGCMPISPEMVDDAESFIPLCPLRAASAGRKVHKWTSTISPIDFIYIGKNTLSRVSVYAKNINDLYFIQYVDAKARHRDTL